MSPAIGAIEFQAAVEIKGGLLDTFLLVLAALFPVVATDKSGARKMKAFSPQLVNQGSAR
jgi:hypothetical protein